MQSSLVQTLVNSYCRGPATGWLGRRGGPDVEYSVWHQLGGRSNTAECLLRSIYFRQSQRNNWALPLARGARKQEDDMPCSDPRNRVEDGHSVEYHSTPLLLKRVRAMDLYSRRSKSKFWCGSWTPRRQLWHANYCNGDVSGKFRHPSPANACMAFRPTNLQGRHQPYFGDQHGNMAIGDPDDVIFQTTQYTSVYTIK